MINHNLLRSKIVLKFGTAKNFAGTLGRPEGYVCRLTTGKQMFTQEDIKTWSGVLELSDSDIIDIFFAPEVPDREQSEVGEDALNSE